MTKCQDSASHNTSPEPARTLTLQRQCACGQHTVAGGECAECRKKRPSLQRRAAHQTEPGAVPPIVHNVLRSPGQPLDPASRTLMESRFGHDFSQVRVHSDAQAAASARAVNALAYTVGQDIVFGTGAYAPRTTAGQRLLAHELTHTLQQGSNAGGVTQAQLNVNRPGDPLEQEADRIAERVVHGQTEIGSITVGGARQIQRLELPSWQDIEEGVIETGEAIVETGEEVGEAIVETGEEVGEAIVETGEAIGEAAIEAGESIAEIAGEVWDWATELAEALGGAITVSGTRIIINVPSLPACPTIPIQFSLPEIGGDLSAPVFELPVHELVFITGSIGIHAGLTPEISAQLGPCQLDGLRIVIDPLARNFSASGDLAVTTALGLGGEVRVGLRGDVGALVIIPAEVPIPIEIPLIGVEAGLAGFARGIIAQTVNISGSMSYSGGRFSLSAASDIDLGLAADLGVAGYGQLDLLGQTVCRLYWPLWAWQDSMTLSTGVDAALDVSTSGVSASVNLATPQIDQFSFEDMPIDLERDMFADQCMLIDILCTAGYALGIMPSQNGGAWTGHPAPPWSGPLFVYPRDPSIASGALCRGACGPDCEYCSMPRDEVACEETGDGRHVFWIYPNYVECGTHQGCRHHDACYDWCAAGGEMSIWGPCHRLCDLECACNYPAHQCVGWIFGQEPHDGQMRFSDQPYITGGCTGACPAQSESAEGLTSYRLCLPDIQLFDGVQVGDGFGLSTGDIDLYTDAFAVPYVGLIVVRIVASGGLNASVGAGLGPAWLTALCLDVDPYGAVYRGTAELHVQANLNGLLRLTGSVGALASWFCLLDVVEIIGQLSATGRGNLETELVDRVEVSCQNGEIVLDNAAWLETCLALGFDLDAALNVKLFGFSVISETWNLLRREWGECWNLDIGVLSLPAGGGAAPAPSLGGGAGATPALSPGGAPPMLTANAIDANTLLSWLFAQATDNQETPALPADPATEAGESNPCGPDEIPVVTLTLPPQKAEHLGLYQDYVARRLLQHSLDREDRDTQQRDKWDTMMRGGEMPLETYCWGVGLGLDNTDILRPRWSRDGFYTRRMQVDHIIEWQVRPITGGDWMDHPWNFELLDASSNGSAGPRLRGNINRERRRLARETGDNSWLTDDLTFEQVETEAGAPAGRWISEHISEGQHFDAYEDLTGERHDEDIFQECVRRGVIP